MKLTKNYLKRLIKEEMRKTFISERKEKIKMTKDFSFIAGPGSPSTYRKGQTIPGWKINADGDAEKRIGYQRVVIPSDHFELSSGDSDSASRSDRSYQTMQNQDFKPMQKRKIRLTQDFEFEAYGNHLYEEGQILNIPIDADGNALITVGHGFIVPVPSDYYEFVELK